MLSMTDMANPPLKSTINAAHGQIVPSCNLRVLLDDRDAMIIDGGWAAD